MLTNTHFIILAVIFVVSIILGLLLRIFVQVRGSNFIVNVVNVAILTIFMPIVAYRDISKHKAKYIAEINKDNKLSEIEKKKLRRILSSNKRIARRILLVSIIKCKPLLDLHMHVLNEYYKKHGCHLLFGSNILQVSDREEHIYKSAVYRDLIHV
ncbi:hypothetical protein [Anoxybacillus eryuanensis]|uniref:hypothetical protein n=1 Tax=Anoxybacillus eryuanensis TaxID=651866 RepID=UPI003EF61F4E